MGTTPPPTFSAPEGTSFIREIGVGSVFEVALVETAGTLVVCKRLTPRNRREPAGRAAMVREAEALARCRHPSLPALLAVGSDGYGPFVLESRVDGLSLRAVVERWAERAAPVPPTLALHVAITAARALAELHALEDDSGPVELVHGDLSPDNVLLGPAGDIAFIDLGGARHAGTRPELETEDRGTLPYVAPERARSEGRPDQPSDVYALAASLLFLFRGEPPTPRTEEAALLVEVGERGIPAVRFAGIPEPAATALASALAFERHDRAITAARELAAALAPSP